MTLLACKFANLQVCKYANMQICKYTRSRVTVCSLMKEDIKNLNETFSNNKLLTQSFLLIVAPSEHIFLWIKFTKLYK